MLLDVQIVSVAKTVYCYIDLARKLSLLLKPADLLSHPFCPRLGCEAGKPRNSPKRHFVLANRKKEREVPQ